MSDFPSGRPKADGLKSTDSVEKVAEPGVVDGAFYAARRQFRFWWPHPVAAACGIGINLAILRRFWAVAARRNSSLAPHGPLRRRRSSFKIRLSWANNISTFFRSRLETT